MRVESSMSSIRSLRDYYCLSGSSKLLALLRFYPYLYYKPKSQKKQLARIVKSSRSPVKSREGARKLII